MRFTKEQWPVVRQRPNNCVVFAAPGSGKTTVLINHVMHQLVQRVVSPNELMLVTFTRQAAMEMRNRLRNQIVLSKAQVEGMRIGTFHSLIFRLLLQVNSDIPVILDPMEQRRYVDMALHSQGVRREPRWFLSRLAKMKSQWPMTSARGEFGRVFRAYERLKDAGHRWDFDDVLLAFCRLPSTADWTKNMARVQYLLVDEFQDTNAAQWHIVRVLHEKFNCPVFVVGDDDQSIYGFRGSDPGWLLNFPHTLKDVRSYELTANFRSRVQIVERANQLIEHNLHRVPKHMYSADTEHKGLCRLIVARDERSEAEHVIALVRECVARQPSQTTAVLARTRRQLSLVWQMLRGLGPVQRNVQLRTFHDAKGKEWDHVHVIGAIADNPYLSVDGSGLSIEEERRLFYVAMTRAKESLYVHYPQCVQKRRREALQFVSEAGLT